MSTAFGQNTPTEPEGPQVLPGVYQVRLSVEGKSMTQKFSVTMDPRVQASGDDLQRQFALEMKIWNALRGGHEVLVQIREFYARNKENRAVSQKMQALAHIQPESEAEQRAGVADPPSLSHLLSELERLQVTVDSADVAPTTQATQAAEKILTQLQSLMEQWEKLKG